jgi:hypothetical protein
MIARKRLVVALGLALGVLVVLVSWRRGGA